MQCNVRCIVYNGSLNFKNMTIDLKVGSPWNPGKLNTGTGIICFELAQKQKL